MAEADEPEAGAPSRPPLKLLLEQADRLTALARTSWLTVIVGSLYVWLALAGLRDIQLFLPAEGLVLPFVNVEISTTGFFVFAPALLLSAFLYLHLTLSRLWECYGRILAHPKAWDGRIEGLPVADRVAPWMLNALIENRERRFPLLSVIAAVAFAWVFPPLTIFAIGYRYLRAHEPPLTFYHSLLAAVAIVAAIEFWRHARRTLGTPGSRRISTAPVAVTGVLVGTPLLFVWAQVLIDAGPNLTGPFAVLTPNAQLRRAELSVPKPGWDDRAFEAEDRRRALLRACIRNPETEEEDCDALDGAPERLKRDLRALERAFSDRALLIEAAQLGNEPSSRYDPREELCETDDLVAAARNLRLADLREARLTGGNLTCAELQGADLREARMEGADLRWARMEGAVLWGARMEGAVLWGADLGSTDLRAANFSGSALRSADLTEVSHFDADFWMTAFGDASVTLPYRDPPGARPKSFPRHWPRHMHPPHWADEVLDDAAFLGRWRHWREEQGLPWPPPGKALEGLADIPAVAPPGDP